MLFRPKYFRNNRKSLSYLNDSKDREYNLDDFKNTNIDSDNSFRYGDKNILVSSQQINVDWSRFENHTFFHSATAKVNESFDKIINFYPFDKSKKEIESFEDSLTGFEKWVYDSFPRNVGYLNFSGTMVGETITNGTYIEVIDRTGAKIEDISDRIDGSPILDPLLSPFSFEMFTYVPTIANDNQVVIQKRASLSNNFTIALSSSLDTSQCSVIFGITSGSNYIYVTGSVDKGQFNHLTFMYDKNGDKRAKILINETIHSSSNQVDFGPLNFSAANLNIGIGENVRLNDEVFEIKQSFSGSIDDLKYFHSVNNVNDIKKNKTRSYYPNPEDTSIKLFYKFNEPAGTYQGSNISLDSSGNSLHSYIENYIEFNREIFSDIPVPVSAETISDNIVMFPEYGDTLQFNENLLLTASLYDDFNPNIITRLVPSHYFEDGTQYREFDEEIEKFGSSFNTLNDGTVGKRKSDLPNSQFLLKLLLTYAKFYDELKIFVDNVTMTNFTEYDDYDTTPDVFLKRKAQSQNVVLPDLFKNSTFEQMITGVNIGSDPAQSVKSLNEIQNLVWRRIISEAPKMKLKKGTIDSLKSVFRNTGIEPDNILHFREYGGSQIKSLDGSKEIKKDVFRFLDFSTSTSATAWDTNGYPTDSGIGRIKSGYLSGSRRNPGLPNIAGSFVNGQSDNENDGLYTSGSFTYEGLYKWQQGYQNISESFARMHITGTLSPSDTESCIFNFVGSDEKVSLYFSTVPGSADLKELHLDNLNVFDGDIWYLSFGKKDYHDYESGDRASYFIRASKQINGEILEAHVTSSYFDNDANCSLKNKSEYNTSGSFFVVGEQNIVSDPTSFINANSDVSSINSFSGKISNIRFYSKYTTEEEFLNRTKNYASVGVDNPLVNYNFNNTSSGSFERLILQTYSKQATRETDALGNIRLFDFTQNNIHFEGSNFLPEENVMSNERVEYEIFSDKFDINYSKEKVRIRSFEDLNNKNYSYYASSAPNHEILYSEETQDDNRLSIDMSLMKGLNENIMTVFSDYSFLDDALGKPNNLFSENYFDLNKMREIYFNNVLDQIDIQKYRELFKWIDSSFTDVIYSLIPKHTNFLGINFIYESHVLERNRVKYLYDQIYLKSLDRDNARGNIYLSQYVGTLKKY